MIGRITGTLIEKLPPTVCVDVNGLGYDIDVPMSTLYSLPETGARVTLYTHLTVREDAHILYGFATAGERSAFRELIKVSGIGARTALSVLSGLSVADLAQAITLQESGRLTRVPGIGTSAQPGSRAHASLNATLTAHAAGENSTSCAMQCGASAARGPGAGSTPATHASTWHAIRPRGHACGHAPS